VTREELVAALTLERFTLHRRANPAPNLNTPLPVDNDGEAVEQADVTE
jgi:hypothetical protein